MLIPVFAWGGLIALIGVGICLYSVVMTPMRWVSNFMNTPRPVASPSASGTPLNRAQLQQQIMDDARLTRVEKVERTLKLYESQTPPIVSTSCSQEAGEPLPVLILEVPADIPAQPSKNFIEDQRLLGLKQVVAASEALRSYQVKSVRLELRVRRHTIRVEELNWRFLAETGTVALTANASADDLLTAYRPTQQCWDSLEQAQHIR